MNKPTVLKTTTFLDIPAKRILENAMDEVTDVVLMGYNKESGYYFASSIARGPDILWLLEKYKEHIMDSAT